MNCLAYKVRTWYTHGQWVDVSCATESGCCFSAPLFLHFSFQFPNIKIFVTFFSGALKNRNLKVYTLQPLYKTILGIHSNSRISYPIHVILKVKCTGYIGKGVLHSLLGFNPDSCCLQNRVIMNRAIKRFRCTSMNSGLMYHMYWNRVAVFFFFLSPIFIF